MFRFDSEEESLRPQKCQGLEISRSIGIIMQKKNSWMGQKQKKCVRVRRRTFFMRILLEFGLFEWSNRSKSYLTSSFYDGGLKKVRPWEDPMSLLHSKIGPKDGRYYSFQLFVSDWSSNFRLFSKESFQRHNCCVWRGPQHRWCMYWGLHS